MGSLPHKRKGLGHHVVGESVLQKSGTEAISGLPKVGIAQIRATPTLIGDVPDELRLIPKPTPQPSERRRRGPFSPFIEFAEGRSKPLRIGKTFNSEGENRARH
jgi:hypothetical protein